FILDVVAVRMLQPGRQHRAQPDSSGIPFAGILNVEPVFQLVADNGFTRAVHLDRQLRRRNLNACRYRRREADSGHAADLARLAGDDAEVDRLLLARLHRFELPDELAVDLVGAGTGTVQLGSLRDAVFNDHVVRGVLADV